MADKTLALASASFRKTAPPLNPAAEVRFAKCAVSSPIPYLTDVPRKKFSGEWKKRLGNDTQLCIPGNYLRRKIMRCNPPPISWQNSSVGFVP
jgi:hypothetical protein